MYRIKGVILWKAVISDLCMRGSLLLVCFRVICMWCTHLGMEAFDLFFNLHIDRRASLLMNKSTIDDFCLLIYL